MINDFSPPFNWECPHCFSNTTIIGSSISKSNNYFPSPEQFTDESPGQFGVNAVSIIILCPNPDCREFSLYVVYSIATRRAHSPRSIIDTYKTLDSWQLIPKKSVKQYPDYVPEAIKQDYREAKLVVDTSPKAAAALARRCIQGIIRDYWGIQKDRLKDEIEEIKDKVDSTTWEAIDSTRKIGNIGAHMEKDINKIIEGEPQEASLLIQLIETLIENWYIDSHERKKRLEKIKEVAEDKDQKKEED